MRSQISAPITLAASRTYGVFTSFERRERTIAPDGISVGFDCRHSKHRAHSKTVCRRRNQTGCRGTLNQCTPGGLAWIARGSSVRVMLSVVLLLVYACASGPGELAGKSAKTGEPVRFERLGAVTSTNVPIEATCGHTEVKWCSTRNGTRSCYCAKRYRTQDKIRRMAGQLRNQGIHD